MRRLTSTQIAALRTAAPLIWSGILVLATDASIGLPDWALIIGPLATTFTLWLIAVLAPSNLIEEILLLVRVDGYAYEQDNDLVTPTGRVPQADVVLPNVTDQQLTDQTIDLLLRRDVPTTELEVAAARLDDAIRSRRAVE